MSVAMDSGKRTLGKPIAVFHPEPVPPVLHGDKRRLGSGRYGSARLEPAGYSLSSRFAPSMIGCHPETSEIMITSICRSSGALSLAVDL